jgi:acetolactate synthase-1/2/3 large subunit
MSTTRVADYIAQFLASKGVRHTFLVTGGGAMHLNDAFGRCREMEYVACHHEQACAMAAESYFRVSGRVAAVNVTTGPGGTNALTGVYGAYVDSCAMFVVSGQVKTETLISSTPLPLRQLGDQEVDIIAMARPVTKYAELVTDAHSIRFHFEKAWHLCTTGRPGPVWLDIPINVQAALVDTSQLRGFQPEEAPIVSETPDLKKACTDLLQRLRNAKRPVIIGGGGVRISGAHRECIELIDRLGIPVTTAWNAHDILWNDHPLYSGRPGTVGDRGGNFAVQNSDFLLVLGSRLNIRQISYNWKSFARAASITMVDIDAAEMKKATLRIDYPIHADLKDFCAAMKSLPYEGPSQAHREYLEWCRERCRMYPTVLPEYRESKAPVNPYVLMDELFQQLPEDQWVVSGDGTACVTSFQAAQLKKGQRLYTNSGCASMGYDLPGAIGASVAGGKCKVICLAGDGSIQMNVQELQTIQTHRLPIKIFLLNNQGYHSIRQTQHNYFPDNIVGCGVESGLGFPDFQKLAAAFEFPYFSASTHAELPEVIRGSLETPGATLTEIRIDLHQQFSPKLASRKLPDGRMISSPLEDLAPFLPRDEFAKNMLIPLWEEK